MGIDLPPDQPPALTLAEHACTAAAAETEANPESVPEVEQASPPSELRAHISLRLLVALAGAILCAAGVLVGSPWILVAGLASIVATSFIPDRAMALPRWLASGVGSASVAPRTAMLGGTALVALSTIGLFVQVRAAWPLTTWLIGLVLVVGGAVFADLSSTDRASIGGVRLRLPSIRSFDAWMLAALTAAGLFLRVRRLETLPPMHGDEGEMAMLALRVQSDFDRLPPFTAGFLDHPTLFQFLQKLSMSVFGQSVSGVRMGTALFGALCIPAVYAVGRLGWSRRVGLVAASILAFSHIHIHFSRMALNNMHSVFFGCVMVALVLWCDRSLMRSEPAITPLVGVGLTCGVAQYLYYGSRLFPVVLAVAMGVFAWRYRAQFKRLMLVPFGFVLGWLPMVPWYLKNPGTFSSRQSGVNVFSDPATQAAAGEGTWDVLVYQVQRNLRFFIDAGDVSSFYFRAAPGLDALGATLFWIGLGLALSKVRSFPNQLVLSWFVLGLVLGGVLTSGAPSATRLLMIYPAIALLGGLTVDHFAGLLTTSSRSTHWSRAGLVIVVALVLAQSGIRTYFGQFADNPPQAYTDAIGREFALQDAATDTYLIGAPRLFAQHGTLRFTSFPEVPQNLDVVADIAAAESPRSSVFVAALPGNEQQIRQVAEVIPGGEVREVRGPTGELWYFAYQADR